MTSIETHRLAFVASSKCLHIVKLLMFSVCASQAAARKAQPLWQQLGFQAKINERKKNLVLFSKCIDIDLPEVITFSTSVCLVVGAVGK